MKIFFLSFIMSILLAGCMGFTKLYNTEFNFRVTKDPFYPDSKIVNSKDFVLLWTEYPNHLYFNPSCVITMDSSSSTRQFYFNFLYLGEDWKFFDNLKFLYGSDKKVVEYNSEVKDNSVLKGGSVSEAVSFEIEEHILKELIKVNQFSIRISGSKGRYDLTFPPKLVSGINEFYLLSLNTSQNQEQIGPGVLPETRNKYDEKPDSNKVKK